MTDKTGGPAFPVFPESGNGHAAAFKGMTLRDYFAGQALAGQALVGMVNPWGGSSSDQTMAKFSYQMADALLAERDK